MAATPISDQCPGFAEGAWLAQTKSQREALQQQEDIKRELREMEKNCIALLASINKILKTVEGK